MAWWLLVLWPRYLWFGGYRYTVMDLLAKPCYVSVDGFFGLLTTYRPWFVRIHIYGNHDLVLMLYIYRTRGYVENKTWSLRPML
jgi:hypothetical protein